ncbi:FAD-dependent oxidoreductase [Bailinhaonella thermotolerans]|uniref:FAD-dependent oxidoreductase n=1 Tax=Bailinhaonella thermotolerans TaxID=1070861 RepID=A0A3A4A3A1_9ACTN|nr:FAD-dependent oxidoreductase [Bailinhaonella thermotolerans]RJL23246.1 FAD-dependent oxidoreductase [Bailinhaonella thermotolerans]
MRVGIVGGGIAGLTVAWLLGEAHEPVVFEARSRIGGNIRSIHVQLDGHEVSLELGTQDISPGLFPAHRRLLRELGFTARQFRPIPSSLSISRADRRAFLATAHETDGVWGRRPVLGPAARALDLFLEQASKWEEEDVDWTVPLAELVEPLPVPARLKRNVLYARTAALFCCSIDQARELSARGAAAFYVGGSGDPGWDQLAPGLEAAAWALAAATPRLTLRVGTEIRRVRREHGLYELTDSGGRTHLVDRVVLAVPAYAALAMLESLAGSGRVRDVLAAFPYVDTSYALHLDPVYMPRDRRHWSTSNLIVDGEWCESCEWYRPVHGPDVFKSLVAHRAEPPGVCLYRAGFRHLFLSPGAVRAQRRLTAFQGRGGLYFAGNHFDWVASQESAVTTALGVVRDLAPESPRLSLLAAAAGGPGSGGSPVP